MTNKDLLNELYNRYSAPTSWRARVTFFRKKYAYLFVVSVAKGIKRLLDVLLSLLGLIVLSPLFLLIALLIKCTDGGPVFYVSTRIGKWGRPFRFYKFRSMHPGADKEKPGLLKQNIHKEGVTFKIPDDPRVTWIGKIIRRLSLDELPQLYNVLRGEMSLVGPRPAIPEEVEKYSLENRKRLDITPGITGLWQVSGRSKLNFSKQVTLDVAYIESQSFWSDMLILLKTIPAVILGRGAY
jgi:lipopolysaccharide/colanic/teichoic acid biosynthesis glycosyltransferase